MYISIQQNLVSRSITIVNTNLFAKKIERCINLQLPVVILQISMILDMHHRTTYMYIHFQQIRVSRSVKTVHTNVFANNCKLHKFATTNGSIEKKLF